MRKDLPGFIAQMKIMPAGLDQIKHESQIREQQNEGREQHLLGGSDEGHTLTGSDYVGEVRSSQELELNLSFTQISKQPAFVIPVSWTLTPCHPICTGGTSRGSKI